MSTYENEWVELESYNLSDVEPTDGSFRLPAEGDYRLTCTKLEAETSKAGNPMLTFEFRIDADASGNPTSERGTTLTERRVISEKDFPRQKLRHLLEALSLPITRFRCQDAVGKQIVATVRHEESTDFNPRTGEPYKNARLVSARAAA